MTDKQIIIDGVNVAKCVHLYREIDCLAHMDYSECCEGYDPSYGYCPNTNCYYKQLKRKEQECERLKEGLNLILTVQKNCKLCPHQKLDVDVLVCDLDCAKAFKKIAKSTLQKCEE